MTYQKEKVRSAWERVVEALNIQETGIDRYSCIKARVFDLSKPDDLKAYEDLYNDILAKKAVISLDTPPVFYSNKSTWVVFVRWLVVKDIESIKKMPQGVSINAKPIPKEFE